MITSCLEQFDWPKVEQVGVDIGGPVTQLQLLGDWRGGLPVVAQHQRAEVPRQPEAQEAVQLVAKGRSTGEEKGSLHP
jgi:hypothetical protein